MRKRSILSLSLFSIFFLLLLSGCAKASHDSSSGISGLYPLEGEWELFAINCYQSETNNTLLESYLMDGLDRAILYFSREQVAHNINLSQQGTCRTRSNGIYGVSEENSPIVSFIMSGQDSCGIRTTDTMSGIEDVYINVNFEKDHTELIRWFKENGFLYLKAPNSFQGSDDASFCNENCYCMWLLRSETSVDES